MGCYHKIVIQCKHTINLPPLVTYVELEHDSELITWSELCRRTIEHEYLHSSTYLLALLQNIMHSNYYSYTTQQQQSNQQQQQQQQHQQLAYRLRYDLGMGTIIKPTWSAAESSSTTSSSSRAGIRGVQMDKEEEEEEEEACYYIDVNVFLQSANNGLKFEPYETIISSLSKGGEEGTTTTTTKTTTFVNLHISPVRYKEEDNSDDDDDKDNVHRCRPFPITKKMTRILICKEHDYFPNYIDNYYFIDDDKNDVDASINNDAVIHFLRNARCMNSLQDSKEEKDEAYNEDSTMIKFDDNVMDSTNKVMGEEPAHDSAINFGQVNKDTHENIEEGCNDGESSSYEDEETSSSDDEDTSLSSDDDASREKNQQHLPDNNTSKNCKFGESLNKKQLALKSNSPSKNALKRMRRTNDDPINKTDEEAMHRVNDSVSGEERGGIIIATRILTTKRQEDQEEGKKTVAHSCAASITLFNSSESIIPTTESDKHIPAKTAIGFPPGWTMRLIPRIVNNKKRGNNRYYSPKLEYPFLTKGKANEFVKLLDETKGDEKEAMKLFTKRGKGKGKKTALDISASVSSKPLVISASVSSMPLVDEIGLDSNDNTARAIVATTKKSKRTNNTTRALQELASLKVVESLTADAEQSQSKKRKIKPGKNTKKITYKKSM